MSEVKESLNTKIEYTKFILGLNAPFFGCMLYSIKLNPIDNGATTIYTNGKNIYLNKKFCETINKKVFATFILKCLVHICFKHKFRMKEHRDFKIKFSIASSYAVNCLIRDEILHNDDLYSYLSFDENILLYNKDYNKKSSEEVFQLINGIPKDNEIFKSGIDMSSIVEKMEKQEELTNFEKELFNALSMYGEIGNEDLTEGDEDDVDGLIIKSSIMSGFGTKSASIQRLINDLSIPKVNWKQELREFIESGAVDDWSFQVPDRRTMYNDFILPSLVGEKISLGVAVDCSGSIGEDELKTFLSEIYSMFKQYNSIELHLLSFDSEVCNDKIINNETELMDFEFIGGGGTDFIPVFKRLEEDGKYQLLVMFTDGYGSFPESSSIKSIFIMTSEVEPPFGKVIKYTIN